MTIKLVDDLKGRELDAWTYKALGYGIERHEDSKDRWLSTWWHSDKDDYARMHPHSGYNYCLCINDSSPSSTWTHMGQILRRFPVSVMLDNFEDGWLALVEYNSVISVATEYGPDPMPAFCKALIKCVYGEEVDDERLYECGRNEEWRGKESFQGVP